MSWSPDLFIGEFRPWPDTVQVVRGKTDETRRYVPEEMLFHERDGHDEQFERARSLEDENARLRSCLSDDAENARMILAENEKLRELVRAMVTRLAYADRVVDGGVFDARLRREVAKLGIEMDDA